ncbi:MAG TPA: magnesium chelatase, partial [Arachidicoccus soli]|nr:magnesium chelatase [Arachidicoccus soli]
YTNRGSIVTPLKDRIESQILTHYPKDLETALRITEQEARILPDQLKQLKIADILKRIVEQLAFEARSSEYVDKKSGVSARLSISALENLISSAERRAILNKEKDSQVWISDLSGIIPAITGKIELVYEGEQEGPYQVALHLLEKAIRTQFLRYFPTPSKRTPTGKTSQEAKEQNPYKKIIQWFDQGNIIDIFVEMKDTERIENLYKVDGLYGLVKKQYPQANEKENALLMEFVLHGLSAHSLISKKTIEGQIRFNDLIGSMMNFSDDE